MIARFFQQLLNSCGLVFRTFRAFLTRQVVGLRARIRRVTSLSRQAVRLVPKAMSTVAVAGKKPTKREDFVETKRLFVAKSLLIMLVLGLIAFGLLFYFVIWPWLVRMFFTARLYQNDEAVATYSGKVVVCYDEEKDMPMLQGKMEDGMIQGQGKAYDEAGRVQYEGAFVNGLYEGKGSYYEEGVLVYTGDFAGGVYEGKGTLYEDGEILYEGQFAGGLREGTGTAYEDGVVCYKGDFAADLYDGTGTSYYPNGQILHRGGYLQGKYDGEGTLYYENGQVQYKGGFLDGLYDQTGNLYNEDGSLLYQGGFLQGLYSGDGMLNITKDLRLTGTFEAGEPVGAVTIHWGGKLYYEGYVEGLVPHGEGTLYASTGESIYVGNMIHGVPDLGALLNKTGDEVRAAFGEAELMETPGERNGFSINNKALGVTLFCTYKTEEADPTVYYVYGYDRDADPFAEAMSWHTPAEYEAQAAGYDKQERDESAVFTGGVPYPNGTYHRTAYYYEDYVFVGWSQPGETEWVMVEWIVNQSLPGATGSGSAGEEGNAGRMDSLLGKLGLTEDAGATGEAVGDSQTEPQTSGGAAETTQTSAAAASSGATAALSAASETPGCKYYGTAAPLALLGGATSGSALESGLTAMADYYLQGETRQAMEEQAAWKKALLTAEEEKCSMGTGSQETVDALTAEVNKLELSANRAMVAMEKIQLEAKGTLMGELADYDLTEALFLVDPATLDVDALQGAGNSEAIALGLMDLELAWQELLQAQTDYNTAKGDMEKALEGYAMGTVDETARCDALCAHSQATVDLHTAIHGCAVQMYALNTLTNGMLASQYDWLAALSR